MTALYSVVCIEDLNVYEGSSGTSTASGCANVGRPGVAALEGSHRFSEDNPALVDSVHG
jgi:hypothetical protein